MEGIVDVYQEYFMNMVNPKVHFFKKDRHSCLICSLEPKDGSYGKFNRVDTKKIIVEYLEHLKIFGFSNKLAQVFINSVRDSGILCKKVKGLWKFKEHETEYVFIIEHCLNLFIPPVTVEIPKVVSSPSSDIIDDFPQEKVKIKEEKEEQEIVNFISTFFLEEKKKMNSKNNIKIFF